MPQKKSEYEDYLKFINEALELAKKLLRYFSKFNNKILYKNNKKELIIQNVVFYKLNLFSLLNHQP